MAYRRGVAQWRRILAGNGINAWLLLRQMELHPPGGRFHWNVVDASPRSAEGYAFQRNECRGECHQTH